MKVKEFINVFEGSRKYVIYSLYIEHEDKETEAYKTLTFDDGFKAKKVDVNTTKYVSAEQLYESANTNYIFNTVGNAEIYKVEQHENSNTLTLYVNDKNIDLSTAVINSSIKKKER